MATVERISLGDLPAIWVSSPSKASVKVALLGGTVYSYITADGIERMFLSKDVVTDGSKGIRGGIPIVFPQFGPGRLKQHGFARSMPWEFDEKSVVSDGDKVSFKVFFTSNNSTKALWDFDFLLELRVEFDGNNLETTMTVTNTGEVSFRFQYLLHTYHLLPCDIEALVIRGVDGMDNLDKLKPVGEMLNTFRGDLVITENHDSIYMNKSSSNKAIHVLSSNSKEVFTVQVGLTEDNGKEHPTDVVIWNPWVEKAKAMSDFGNDEYRRMVCIEPGCVSRYETCLPSRQWSLYQHISYRVASEP